jgi:competence protein ComEC
MKKLSGYYLLISIAAIFGIVLAYNSYQPLVCIITFLFFLFLYLRSPKIVVIVASICVVLFAIYFEFYDFKNHTKLEGSKTNTYIAKITTSPDINGTTFSTIIKLSEERVLLRYTIKTAEEKTELAALKIGMVCEFEGKLMPPNKARNFNAFDYKKYLYFKKIHWIVSPTSISLQNCYQQSLTPYQKLLVIRENGITYIEKNFPKETIGITQALIYGERGYIEDEVLTSYQSLGLVHLLAISGLHIGLLTGAVFFLGIRLGLTRETVNHSLLFLLPVYTVLAGAAPSVVRASLMLMIILGCIKWKKVNPIDSIGLACFLMVVINPYHVFEVGFQLSFVVSLGLILSSKTIILKVNNPLIQTLTVTAIAQLSSFPILIFYFFEISLLSIPYNLIFVPAYSIIILPLAILTLLLHILFEPVGHFLMYFLDISIKVLNEFALFGANYKSFSFIFGRPHILFLVGYFILLVNIFRTWEQPIKKRIVVSSILFTTLLLSDLNARYVNPYGTITFIDIGQGDSILIELPFNQGVYLIDTGPKTLSFSNEEWRKKRRTFDTGMDILLPYLKSNGIRKVDKLIITHGDLDHIGNAEVIIQELNVEELIIGAGPIEKEYEKRLLQLCYEKGIPIDVLTAGDYWQSGDYTFHVLGPTGYEQTSNNRSVVLYSVLGGLKWLFTGDLEDTGEERLLSVYKKLPVDVLKVGHHGSNTSTSAEFVAHIKPKISIVSVGTNNRYNHPHPEVITRLNGEGSFILRTDHHGAIQYKFRDESGTFKWMLPYNKTILNDK